MEITSIENYLYSSKSEQTEIYSFLNFLYTNVEDNIELSTAFFNAFENAYTKESIIAILNQNSRKDDKIGEIITFQNTKDFHDQIYKVIKQGTFEIKKAHEVYLHSLKEKKQSIKYIIIGEAPPFSFTKTQKEGKIVLDFRNNYILSKKNAGIWQSSIRGAFEITIENKNNKMPDEFIKGLLDKNILFFDIVPVTLPFSTDVRTGWIDKTIEANDNPLLVNLLQLAIKKNVDGLTIDPNVRVAFVTPPKTSVSIFDYYSDKKLKINNEISVDITIINDNTTKKKYLKPEEFKNIILPMYKANAMMGSNAPSPELLKLALDL